jgi:hypothetical protein
VAGQNVRALGRGADGNAYYLLGSNIYSSANSSTPWDTGIAAMAVTASGMVYEQGTAGNLYWQNPATNAWASVAGQNVRALGRGADGNAYYLLGSNIYSSANSSTPWDTGIAAMAVTAAGVIYEQGGAGHSSYWQNPATGAWATLAYPGALQDLGRGADGNAYYLKGGALYSSASPLPFLTGVTSFGIAGNGMVVSLDINGHLWEQNAAGAYSGSYFSDTNGSLATLNSFAIAGNGMVVGLGTSSNLWEQTSTGTTSFGLALPTLVNSFGIAGNGMVVSLDVNGHLWEQNAAGAYSGSYFTRADGSFANVNSFAIARDGMVVSLDTSGNLWEQTGPGATSFGAGAIASGVQSFVVDGSGSVDLLGNIEVPVPAGNLIAVRIVEVLESLSPGSTTPQIIDSGVQAFGLSCDGQTICTLEQDGTLAAFTASMSRTVVGQARLTSVELPQSEGHVAVLDLQSPNGTKTVYVGADAQLTALINQQPLIPQSVMDVLGMAADTIAGTDVRVCAQVALGSGIKLCFGTNGSSVTLSGPGILPSYSVDSNGNVSFSRSATLATPDGGYTISIGANQNGDIRVWGGAALGAQYNGIGGSITMEFGQRFSAGPVFQQVLDTIFQAGGQGTPGGGSGSGGGGYSGQPFPMPDPGSGDPYNSPPADIGVGGGILTIIFELF